MIVFKAERGILGKLILVTVTRTLLTESSDITKLLILRRREIDELVDHHDHLRFTDDLDELTKAKMCLVKCATAHYIVDNIRLDRLVLHFGDLVLNQCQNLPQHFVLHTLVSDEAILILLDLEQQIVQTHVPSGRIQRSSWLRLSHLVSLPEVLVRRLHL